MRHVRLAIAVVIIGLLFAARPAAAQVPGSKVSADTVPLNVLQDLQSYFRPKTPATSREQYLRIMERQMATVIKLGGKIEAEHSKATNLYQVHAMMLYAAELRERAKPEPSRSEQVRKIAQKIMAGRAPEPLKLRADYIITGRMAAPAKDKPAKDAEKQIRAFLKRHEAAPAGAAMYAAMLAREGKLPKLHEEMVKLLETRHASDQQVLRYLLYIGRKVKFQAELTRLDGTKLTLPDDLLGKVVVIDFWATWCKPCLQSLPHMKKIYAAYKDKGVEFVGISLDRPGTKAGLKAFIKKNGMGWIHTYSGKMWNDPTARKYGISGIPAIWAIGRDGSVVSQNARADLEATIAKALKTPTTRPEPAGEKETK